jgi:hypothetical protein
VRFTNTGRGLGRGSSGVTLLGSTRDFAIYTGNPSPFCRVFIGRAQSRRVVATIDHGWHLVLDRRVSIFHVACVVLINPRESIILKKHCAWYQHHAPTRCLLKSILCTGRGGVFLPVTVHRTGVCPGSPRCLFTVYRGDAAGRPARRARDKGDDGRLSAAPYRATVCGYLLGRRTA